MLLAILLLSGAPGADSILAAHREQTRVVRPCREAAAGGEIVVCAKRGSVYRLPDRAPEPGSRAARAADGYNERLALHGRAVDAGGIGSCSPVGAGGWSGCTKGLGLVGLGRSAAPGIVGGLFRAVDIDD